MYQHLAQVAHVEPLTAARALHEVIDLGFGDGVCIAAFHDRTFGFNPNFAPDLLEAGGRPRGARQGRYIGEGFDDQRLDTLFLTMPISWKGTLAQYVGRLHRQHEGKTEVLVVDYVDEAVPLLARMAAKRWAGYRALGYAKNAGEIFTDDVDIEHLQRMVWKVVPRPYASP
jgi:hypothetical protein